MMNIEATEPKAVVEELSTKLDLPLAVVEGVLGDLAHQKESHLSQNKIAERWGVGFGEISRMRRMGHVAIADIREAAITKKLIIANTADELLIDALSDPVKVEKISARDLSQISKQHTDSALNLANGRTGPTTQQINIGDMKVLIQRQAARAPRVPIREKLAARGIDVETIAQSP
jgi:hypothetical protein